MEENPWLLAALIGAIVLAVVVAVMIWRQRGQQRSKALREHFGPEYDHALEQHGSRTRAERELALRAKRVHKLHIHLLSAEQCERFGAAWSDVQQRFVDDPSGAVHDADGLVKQVMSARGYPMGDFEQRVADLSVEHANVLHHYRAAREVAVASSRGEATTEELRQAMVRHRSLFSDLLQSEAPQGRLSTVHP